MRLLLIEDNQQTQQWLSKGLKEEGYNVDIISDGRDGLMLAMEQNYSLIMLDIMLPGMDGWQLLRVLRSAKNVPVICLTARDSVADRIKGLELGANDYLVKPFSFAELLARIRVQLRQNRVCTTWLQLEDLQLDAAMQLAYRAGHPLSLTRKEFGLLWLLAQHHGQILSRTLIASEVWGINYDNETNIVDVAIRRLRSKVDDDHSVKLIITVRGMGYMLNIAGK